MRRKILTITATIMIILAGVLGILYWIQSWSEGEEKPPHVSPLTEPVTSYVSVIDGNAKLFIDDKPVDILGLFPTNETIEYIDKASRYRLLFCRVRFEWALLDKVTVNFFKENPDMFNTLNRMVQEARLKDAIELLPDFPVPENASDWIRWEVLDELLDYAASKGVYLIIDFHYFTPPIWWIKAFPDQLQTNGTGTLSYMSTFNSPALIKYASQVIRTLVIRYRRHPALLGWGLSFGWTVEDNYPGPVYYASWGIYDYSPCAIERFRKWLRERYGNNTEALRDAWGDPSIDFDNATPPLPMPQPTNATEWVFYLNGPGDTRMAWLDWCEFRLQEKVNCMLYFANLYESLDPDHVLIQTAGTPFTGPTAGVIPLNIGYWYYINSPVDIVYVNPGLNGDAASGISTFGYPAFLKYFEQRGKAAFIKWEGRPGVDYDAHPEYIELVARMARLTGTGLAIWGGNVPMPEPPPYEEFQPEFTDEQIERFIQVFRSTPEGHTESADIAIIDDPRLCFFEYHLFNAGSGLRPFESMATLSLFRLAGYDPDVLAVDEILENPDILSRYKLIVLCDFFRMREELVNILTNYVASGGGLFIVGRTGLYDWYGTNHFQPLRKLLNISSEISDVKLIRYSWRFENAEDPLLKGLGGLEGDIQSQFNIYFIPKFDYETEGFKVLATIEGHRDLAAIVRKGKVVAWFPRFGLQLMDRSVDDLSAIIRFIKNLCDFLGVEKTGGPLPQELQNLSYPISTVFMSLRTFNDILILREAMHSEVKTLE
ncbi:hypothetical protein DRN89_01135 [archaeon]|nr:MAG: hypothetical protein DRN89_01135 [archaeon]